MTIVPLKVAAAEPERSVVATIEGWLEMAKAGNVRAIAAAYVDGGGFTWQECEYGDVEIAKVVGATSRLLHKLNTEWDDADE